MTGKIYVILIVIAIILIVAIAIFHQVKKEHRAAEAPVPEEELHPLKSIFTRSIKVAGVTFDNDDGSSRQRYLEMMQRHQPPFDGKQVTITLHQYQFENETAIAVLCNNCQIGNIPRSDLPAVLANYDYIKAFRDFEIVGRYTLGAHFEIVFEK